MEFTNHSLYGEKEWREIYDLLKRDSCASVRGERERDNPPLCVYVERWRVAPLCTYVERWRVALYARGGGGKKMERKRLCSWKETEEDGSARGGGVKKLVLLVEGEGYGGREGFYVFLISKGEGN